MSSLTASLTDLLSSIFNIFRSILAVLISTLESITAVFTNLVSGVVGLGRGLVGFLLDNIVILGVLIAAFVGYSAYRQKNQGGGVTAGKKRA